MFLESYLGGFIGGEGPPFLFHPAFYYTVLFGMVGAVIFFLYDWKKSKIKR